MTAEAAVKLDNSDRESAHVAKEILAYLVENPQAQDTLEGVMSWWLLHRRIKSETARVKAALAKLIERGFIVEHRGADSRVRYAVNHQRLPEIRELLGGGSNAAGGDPGNP